MSVGNLVVGGANGTTSTLLATIVSVDPALVQLRHEVSARASSSTGDAISEGRLRSPGDAGAIAQVKLDDE